jgi:hypothetical protein
LVSADDLIQEARRQVRGFVGRASGANDGQTLEPRGRA